MVATLLVGLAKSINDRIDHILEWSIQKTALVLDASFFLNQVPDDDEPKKATQWFTGKGM